MARTTWEAFSADLRDDDVERLVALRDFCTSWPDVVEEVHRTELRYRVVRTFAVGFLLAHRLELAVDLPERVDHPRLLEAFPTTKGVVTHRLSLPRPDDFDDTVKALLARAHDEVGPGYRAQR